MYGSMKPKPSVSRQKLKELLETKTPSDTPLPLKNVRNIRKGPTSSKASPVKESHVFSQSQNLSVLSHKDATYANFSVNLTTDSDDSHLYQEVKNRRKRLRNRNINIMHSDLQSNSFSTPTLGISLSTNKSYRDKNLTLDSSDDTSNFPALRRNIESRFRKNEMLAMKDMSKESNNLGSFKNIEDNTIDKILKSAQIANTTHTDLFNISLDNSSGASHSGVMTRFARHRKSVAFELNSLINKINIQEEEQKSQDAVKSISNESNISKSPKDAENHRGDIILKPSQISNSTHPDFLNISLDNSNVTSQFGVLSRFTRHRKSVAFDLDSLINKIDLHKDGHKSQDSSEPDILKSEQSKRSDSSLSERLISNSIASIENANEANTRVESNVYSKIPNEPLHQSLSNIVSQVSNPNNIVVVSEEDTRPDQISHHPHDRDYSNRVLRSSPSKISDTNERIYELSLKSNSESTKNSSDVFLKDLNLLNQTNNTPISKNVRTATPIKQFASKRKNKDAVKGMSNESNISESPKKAEENKVDEIFKTPRISNLTHTDSLNLSSDNSNIASQSGVLLRFTKHRKSVAFDLDSLIDKVDLHKDGHKSQDSSEPNLLNSKQSKISNSSVSDRLISIDINANETNTMVESNMYSTISNEPLHQSLNKIVSKVSSPNNIVVVSEEDTRPDQTPHSQHDRGYSDRLLRSSTSKISSKNESRYELSPKSISENSIKNSSDGLLKDLNAPNQANVTPISKNVRTATPIEQDTSKRQNKVQESLSSLSSSISKKSISRSSVFNVSNESPSLKKKSMLGSEILNSSVQTDKNNLDLISHPSEYESSKKKLKSTNTLEQSDKSLCESERINDTLARKSYQSIINNVSNNFLSRPHQISNQRKLNSDSLISNMQDTLIKSNRSKFSSSFKKNLEKSFQVREVESNLQKSTQKGEDGDPLMEISNYANKRKLLESSPKQNFHMTYQAISTDNSLTLGVLHRNKSDIQAGATASSQSETRDSTKRDNSKQMTLKTFLERMSNKKNISPKQNSTALQDMLRRPLILQSLSSEKPKRISKKTKPKQPTNNQKNFSFKYNRFLFQHYSKHKLSKEGALVFHEAVEQFFKNLSSDLECILNATNSKILNQHHIYLLLKGLNLIKTEKEMNCMLQEFLPVDVWKNVLPVQYAYNKVYPEKK